jgi:polyphosphate kinase
LEELYKIRVAEHKAVANGGYSEDMTQEEAQKLIRRIGEEVNKQLEDRIRIYEQKLIPALKENHIIFYHETPTLYRGFSKKFFDFSKKLPQILN